MRKMLAVLLTLSMLSGMVPYAAADELDVELTPPAIENAVETEAPTVPAETETPVVPGETETPAVPGETETPAVPGEMETPAVPGETETPAVPAETETPAVPGETEPPAVPAETKTPEVAEIVPPVVSAPAGVAFVYVSLDGEPVADAQVTLEETGDTSATDHKGLAKFIGLEEGTYSVTVSYESDGESLSGAGTVTVAAQENPFEGMSPMARIATGVTAGQIGSTSIELFSGPADGQFKYTLTITYKHVNGEVADEDILRSTVAGAGIPTDAKYTYVVGDDVTKVNVNSIVIQFNDDAFAAPDDRTFDASVFRFDALSVGARLVTDGQTDAAIIDFSRENALTVQYVYENVAAYFIRTDGGFIPEETGNIGYESGLYVPNHYALPNHKWVGAVKDVASWTDSYGEIETVDGISKVNGKRLVEAFKAVEENLIAKPSDDDVKGAISSFDPTKQAVAWYVTKDKGTCGRMNKIHVDGIIYDKDAEYVLQYFPNTGNASDKVSGLPVTKLYIPDATANISFGVSRVGYRFLGWSTAPDGEIIYKKGGDVKTILMDSDKYLYAQWEALPSYSVSYEYDGPAPAGVTPPTSSTHMEDSTVTIAQNQTADGWTFEGWTVKTDGVTVDKGKFTMPGSDVLIVGKWTKNVQYTVTYKDGSGADAKTYTDGINRDAGETYTVLDGIASAGFDLPNENVYFTGWKLVAPTDVSVATSGTATQPNANVVYEAQYATKGTYTVVYTAGDGGIGDDLSRSFAVDKGYTVMGNELNGAPIFTKPNYIFTGWLNEDGHATTPGAQVGALAEDSHTTYVAQWEAVSYGYTLRYYNVTTGTYIGDPVVNDNFLAQFGYTVQAGDVTGALEDDNWQNARMPSGYRLVGVTYPVIGEGENVVLVSYEVIPSSNVTPPDDDDDDEPGGNNDRPGDNGSGQITPPEEPGETEIPDMEVPLGPGVTIPDALVPLGPADGSEDGDIVIVDEGMPLGDLPQTGSTRSGARAFGMMGMLAAITAAGLALVVGRKKSDEG